MFRLIDPGRAGQAATIVAAVAEAAGRLVESLTESELAILQREY